MKVVANKINNFTPVTFDGLVDGTYYIDQSGQLVSFPSQIKPHVVHVPYVASLNIANMDDVCNIHISELEDMVAKLKANIANVNDHDLKMKYTGYIEALNYVISHNSFVDPWSDYIEELQSYFDYYMEGE